MEANKEPKLMDNTLAQVAIQIAYHLLHLRRSIDIPRLFQ